MTVKELREELMKFPDDMKVVVPYVNCGGCCELDESKETTLHIEQVMKMLRSKGYRYIKYWNEELDGELEPFKDKIESVLYLGDREGQ